MKIHKVYIVVGLIIAFGLFFELVAHADETNEETRITFSQTVQIPGQVLPAGTYIFQQADPNSDLNLIQIFNSDRTVLYATLQTVPVERMDVTGETTITMAEPEAGKPDVLVKWFYPGRLTGHEFVYSKQQEQEIAQARQQTFVGSQLMPSAEAAGE
ncbi:MAG TPA: hypothetical protein VJX16_26680 [Terriglobales bacterium]|nr:hypothetical protein [Terriglobales bacterium]